MSRSIRSVGDLATPALIIERAALEANLAAMAAVWPSGRLRPHVKAHKCTSLAARQVAHGHHTFTCATPREVLGMAVAGVGTDLLLANETLDATRLGALAGIDPAINVTVAVDSPETIDAAAMAGVRSVLIDVNVGLPRAGCSAAEAGLLADRARSQRLEVRGVMGYEGHLMMVIDRDERRARVAAGVDLLLAAHAAVGGDIISAGGTGTWDVHDRITELQAGSYVTFAPGGASSGDEPSGDDPAVSEPSGTSAGWPNEPVRLGGRVRVVPAHVDPTMAMHEVAWLVDGDDVLERWPIDLRGW